MASPRLRASIAAVVLLGTCLTAYAETGVLFSIPSESRATQPLSLDRPWHLVLTSQDPAAIARQLGIPAPQPGGQTLDYIYERYPSTTQASSRTWLESTFVIDYAEPAVKVMFAEFEKTIPRPWTPPMIAHFVSQHMKTSYGRLFDIASEVAQRREGDCTEYAVLTTALARAAGMKARVAMGLALVPKGAALAVWGHAWTEVQADGRWIVLDATADGVSVSVRYLPGMIIEAEGPGFGLEMARFNSTFIQRVVVLDDTPPAQASASTSNH